MSYTVIYTVIVHYEFMRDGEEVDPDTDTYCDEYSFESYDEAIAEYERYRTGDVVGEYDDGTKVIVSGVELCEAETGELLKAQWC